MKPTTLSSGHGDRSFRLPKCAADLQRLDLFRGVLEQIASHSGRLFVPFWDSARGHRIAANPPGCPGARWRLVEGLARIPLVRYLYAAQ
jgi:hypothetical protein